MDQAVDYAEAVAEAKNGEKYARLATSKLYHALSAALLTWEGSNIAEVTGDATRLLMSRFIVEHYLDPADSLTLPENDSWEEEASRLLLDDIPIPSTTVHALL